MGAIVYSTVYSGADKKTSKLRVTGRSAGTSPDTGEFPAQRASNAEYVSFDDVIMAWWCFDMEQLSASLIYCAGIIHRWILLIYSQ